MQSRLHWHCHFMQKLEDEPAIEIHNMLRAADGLREAETRPDRLAAWEAGCTGAAVILFTRGIPCPRSVGDTSDALTEARRR